MRIIIIFLASLLVFTQTSFSQTTSKKGKKGKSVQKEERPSVRQLDLLERMHFDMSHPNVTDVKGYAFMEAYNGYKDFWGADKRIAQGLTNELNLIDLIHAARNRGGLGSTFMDVVFLSLNQEEKNYFLSLNDEELGATAKKYARWTNEALEQWQSQPKY